MQFDKCESLEEAKSAKEWSFEGHDVEAICIAAYDCDTFTIAFRLFDIPTKITIRLAGVDGTEKKNKNLKEKQLAYMALDRLNELIKEKWLIYSLGEADKYGRILGSVKLENGDDLAEVLIKEHYCQRYDGGTKQAWDDFMQEHWPDLKSYEK